MNAERASSGPMRLQIPGRFARFLAAGACGIVADAGALLLLVQIGGWSGVPARLTSFAAAVLLTWTINRLWAFRDSSKGAPMAAVSQFVDYATVQIAGGALNLAIYSLMLPHTGSHSTGLLLALACGSATGLLVNYIGARTFVFATSEGKRKRSITLRVVLAAGAVALAALPLAMRAGGAG